ncbi:hypothetical protein HDU84_002106 [Entophlyctis sp. JEL0112]|nr:hypothetical protein HDU84_002106 [Entophlyctis sp. JEL0112]
MAPPLPPPSDPPPPQPPQPQPLASAGSSSSTNISSIISISSPGALAPPAQHHVHQLPHYSSHSDADRASVASSNDAEPAASSIADTEAFGAATVADADFPPRASLRPHRHPASVSSDSTATNKDSCAAVPDTSPLRSPLAVSVPVPAPHALPPDTASLPPSNLDSVHELPDPAASSLPSSSLAPDRKDDSPAIDASDAAASSSEAVNNSEPTSNSLLNSHPELWVDTTPLSSRSEFGPPKKHKKHKSGHGHRSGSSRRASFSNSSGNDFFSSDAPIQLSSTAKPRKDSLLSTTSAASTISAVSDPVGSAVKVKSLSSTAASISPTYSSGNIGSSSFTQDMSPPKALSPPTASSAEIKSSDTLKPPLTPAAKKELLIQPLKNTKEEAMDEFVGMQSKLKTTATIPASESQFAVNGEKERTTPAKNNSLKSLNPEDKLGSMSAIPKTPKDWKKTQKAKAEDDVVSTNGGESDRDSRVSKETTERAAAKAVEALRRDRSKKGAKSKLNQGECIMVANKAIPLSAINNTDRSGRTPLFKVSGNGDMEAVSALIRAGADVNTKDYAGWSPLHEACIEGQLKVCNLLIRYGADVNALGFDNQTPLHDAVGNNHYDVVELLLSHGASLTSTNKSGSTPMDETEDETMIQLLQMWKRMMVKVVEVDEHGLTLLHTYAMKGDLKGVKRVLKYGAEVDFACYSGWTPLHEAASKGHVSIVEELCRYGANLNATAKTKLEDASIEGGYKEVSGITPLMDAAAGCFVDAARVLLEFGADTQLVDSNGKQALDYVTESSPVADDLRALLQRPASSWKPPRNPDFIKTKPGCAGMMTHIRDQASLLLEKTEARSGSKDPKLKVTRKNSISSDTSHSTNLNGSLSSRGITVSATTAAAVGLGGPTSFSWGGLDPRDREGQFESAREERKFRKLLETLEAQNGPSERDGASASGGNAGAPAGGSSAASAGTASKSKSGLKQKKSEENEDIAIKRPLNKKIGTAAIDSEGEDDQSASKRLASVRDRRNSGGAHDSDDDSRNASGKQKRAKIDKGDGISESDGENVKRQHLSSEDEARESSKKKHRVDAQFSQAKSKKSTAVSNLKPNEPKDKLSSIFDEEDRVFSKKEQNPASAKKELKTSSSKIIPKQAEHPRPQLPFAGTIPKKTIVPTVTSSSLYSTQSTALAAPPGSPVKKKPKKKNLFGISGYQKAGDEPPLISQVSETPPAVVAVVDAVNPNESMPVAMRSDEIADDAVRIRRRKCLPIYQISLQPQQSAAALALPKKAFRANPSSAITGTGSASIKYFVDLQIAFYLGKQSGREVLEMYPGLTTRVATRAQKEQLSASPVGEACLRALLERRRNNASGVSGDDDDDAALLAKARWIRWYERGGIRAMRMEEIDVQFLAADEVLKEIRASDHNSDFETIDLDLEKFDFESTAVAAASEAANGAASVAAHPKFKKFGGVTHEKKVDM